MIRKKKKLFCFLVKADKRIWIKEEVCGKINDSLKRWLSPLSSQKISYTRGHKWTSSRNYSWILRKGMALKYFVEIFFFRKNWIWIRRNSIKMSCMLFSSFERKIHVHACIFSYFLSSEKSVKLASDKMRISAGNDRVKPRLWTIVNGRRITEQENGELST